MTLWCDCCGDQVKVVYPCKFVFHDGLEVQVNVCPNCMRYEKLQIPLARKRLVAEVLKRLKTR